MKETRPRISVVITCFNYARYVGQAIESALGQGYDAAEIVVINDGSTDGSLDVIMRYAAHLRVIDQPNQGWVHAYNRGFAESRGDVVIFLDADDVLDPGSLSAIALHWSPSCAKVQYDLRVIDANGADLSRTVCSFTPDYDATRVRRLFETTGTYRWPMTAGNAYSRWFLEAVMPMEQHGPDGFLNTIAPLYGEVLTIPRPLAAYRIHAKNGWSSSGSDFRRLPERILHRRREIATLRVHAERRHFGLPAGNILDNELVFVNYRLMAWRLGLPYEGQAEDTPYRLFLRAWNLVASEGYSRRFAMTHRVWFAAMLVSPRPMARELFRIRFDRVRWQAAGRKRLRHLYDLLTAATPQNKSMTDEQNMRGETVT